MNGFCCQDQVFTRSASPSHDRVDPGWVRLARLGFARRDYPMSHWVRLARAWLRSARHRWVRSARLASLGTTAVLISMFRSVAFRWAGRASTPAGTAGPTIGRLGRSELSRSVQARQSSRDHHRAGDGNCPVNFTSGEARSRSGTAGNRWRTRRFLMGMTHSRKNRHILVIADPDLRMPANVTSLEILNRESVTTGMRDGDYLCSQGCKHVVARFFSGL